MKYKIVADSSSNILSMDFENFSSVPMHIQVGEKNFSDDPSLDIDDMLATLKAHKGKSHTACPGPGDWLEAFGDADRIFCVTITSGLSGSFVSAKVAKEMYESDYPDRKVLIIDSLSAGPEPALLILKLRELIEEGLDHLTIGHRILEYQKRTHLCFMLSSLHNLAMNGRVNPLLAKGIGIMKIRLVGKASDAGELEVLHKVRGDKKAFQTILLHMNEEGYQGGRVIIAHDHCLQGAEQIAESMRSMLGARDVRIMPTTGLCSYYAEPGSLMIGFESE